MPWAGHAGGSMRTPFHQIWGPLEDWRWECVTLGALGLSLSGSSGTRAAFPEQTVGQVGAPTLSRRSCRHPAWTATSSCFCPPSSDSRPPVTSSSDEKTSSSCEVGAAARYLGAGGVHGFWRCRIFA